jgi:hypothetical protein
MEMRYKLTSKGAGSYHADNILALAWHVFAHRVSHLLHGDGWID